MAVTLREVAELAGVSVPTANQVLNGHTDRFAPATCRRVETAAEQLVYTPNLAARALRRQRSMLLGVLVFGSTADLMPDLLRGIVDVVEEDDHSPIVFCHRDSREQAAALKRCLDRRVEGLIVNVAVDADGTSDLGGYRRAIGLGVPLVEIWGRLLGGVPKVDVDNAAAGRRATEHLLALGHRRIALLTHEHYDASRRGQTGKHHNAWGHFQGYEAAIRAAGGKPIVWTHPLTNEMAPAEDFFRGGQACAQRLRQSDDPPTALVCQYDYQAMGLLRACGQAGLRVGEDLSVVGFGDVPGAALAETPLTTFRSPNWAVGQAAARGLMDLIDGRAFDGATLEPELVVRASTGRPATAKGGN